MIDTAPVPLTGADGFLRAFDDEIRRMHGANHVSQLVLRLGPGFDADGFTKLVERAVRGQPILRAPIRRRLGIGVPFYDLAAAARAPMPRVVLHEREGARSDALPELCHQRLNERMDGRRGELLRFDVVRHAGGALGTDLVMSWLHMLFDGAGSEAFVEWLETLYRGEHEPDDAPQTMQAGPDPGARERGRRATEWQRHVESLTSKPIRSLAGPLRRLPQALRYTVDSFGPEETLAIEKRAREEAGFLTPMLFYLAGALRAHDAVFQERGVEPGGYLVPLPVNLRPKGGDPAIFRTHVSLLWFRVDRELLGDPAALLDELKRQRRESIRAGHVESGVFAMDYARHAPMRAYAHMARRRLGGELCSFFFAFTGEFAGGIERFLGAEIENGFHAAPVPPSPGSSLALSTRSGRLNVTHLFQDAVLGPGEQQRLRDALRAALIGE